MLFLRVFEQTLNFRPVDLVYVEGVIMVLMSNHLGDPRGEYALCPPGHGYARSVCHQRDVRLLEESSWARFGETGKSLGDSSPSSYLG